MFKHFSPSMSQKACSSCTTQEIVAHATQLKKDHAALYLKYAKALESSCPNQALILATMSHNELQHHKQLLDLSCHMNSGTLHSSLDNFPFSSFSPTSASSHSSEETDQSILTPHQKKTLLTWIQPGLAGLMDGSISTLAPIFAAAFATGDTYKTFLVGLSASIGAGFSMGFTEALHDDGKLSGRGSPVKRGIACGLMTMLGGLGHTIPYLIDSFFLATLIAFIIVFFELGAIVWIQNKFMSTPLRRASLQIIFGGALVFATGIFIGTI
ncbi:MAG: putative transmembrane iron-regulated protein [Bartonella clarridgeiae]|nr:membrane protein [Bartonella clarridgeiae]WCR55882.1 MAG: putative transmembrane iron-regulated protein [Bartonella clarridgeiae]